MPATGRFGAVGCAMVTPFDAGGALDTDTAVAVATWLVAHGNDFLVLAGTTGESPVLSDEEKVDLWSAVIAAVNVPVVAGTSTYDTAHSVELTQAARRCGAAGVLAVTPYYSRPSQSGIASHLAAIAEAAGDLPVLLYDIPIRSGRKVETDTILGLARDGIISGLKDAAASPAATAALIAEAPEDFHVYSGNDTDTLPLLAVGAVGAIAVESHWAGELVSEMISAFAKGDIDHARQVNAKLIPSHRFQSSDDTPNPIPAKAAMRELGFAVGECRLPLGPAPAGLAEQARAILQGIDA